MVGGVDVRVLELSAADLGRIREIDRSETAHALYVLDRGELQPVESRVEIASWDEAEVEETAARLARKLAAGGVALGALDGDRLVGIAVLGGRRIGLQAHQLELAFLHVSRGHRGQGVARRLLEEVCHRARGDGAEQLYVSASDTESSIAFYLGRGFRIAEHVDAELAASYEQTDIALTLDLDRDQCEDASPLGSCKSGFNARESQHGSGHSVREER